MHLRSHRKFWIASALVLVFAISAIGLSRAYSVARVGAGYMAQKLCSGVLVSGRTAADVLEENLAGSGLEVLQFYAEDIDHEA